MTNYSFDKYEMISSAITIVSLGAHLIDRYLFPEMILDPRLEEYPLKILAASLFFSAGYIVGKKVGKKENKNKTLDTSL